MAVRATRDRFRCAGICVAALCGTTHFARAQTAVVAWGATNFDSRYSNERFEELEACGYATVARRADGSLPRGASAHRRSLKRQRSQRA